MSSIKRNKPWYKRKRTWFLLFVLICLGLFISSLPSGLGRNIGFLAKAYLEPEICEGALAITKKNKKILKILGELEPMGSLDMLNGSVGYSKGGDSAAITIDVRGDKEIKNIRSKMDVLARRMGGEWEYLNIKVRIKKPEELRQTIPILEK